MQIRKLVVLVPWPPANAPLGARLCIFNKFREPSKEAAILKKAAFGCLANVVLTFIYVRGVRTLPHLPSFHSQLLFSLFSIFLILLLLVLFSLDPLSLSSSFFRPRLNFSPSRGLSWSSVNSSLEHGQQNNMCLLKTSF